VGTLVYIRLIGFTAGTLLMLFWMVVILGYRRQRNFERVFFFFSVALFLFYAGSLLAINSEIYYARPSALLQQFAAAFVSIGLTFLPALLLHLHLEFREIREIASAKKLKPVWLGLAYVPCSYFLLVRTPEAVQRAGFDFIVPGNTLGRSYAVWLFAVALVSGVWEVRLAQGVRSESERAFHWLLGALLGCVLVLIAAAHFVSVGLNRTTREALGTGLALLPLIPLAVLIYMVQRHNFLNIGKQKNLLYAVSATFLALLYLALVRRISESLAAVIPPEATAGILLFVLVIFIEPLQRALGKALKETAQRELDVAQRLAAEIRQQARQGDVSRLQKFLERRIVEQLGVRSARLEAEGTAASGKQDGLDGRGGSEKRAAIPFSPREFPIMQDGKMLSVLHVEPHGAGISGDTSAALDFLCEQMPAAFDLCRLIEEKLQLERELAERERMAALGQMAASISHNLKNPLGSIKTILQVQMENPDMPESLKPETQMVLGEITRLSNKLGQLLQFSRPPVLGEVSSSSLADEVVKEVSEIMRPEAERKKIELEVAAENGLRVTASREVVGDIVSNLLVNGLEAALSGGRVSVSTMRVDGEALIRVEDSGKGIPGELRDRVMEPFFTTKTQGTGLGLAIVARRVKEAGGKLEMESPLADGCGTRFSVWLPLKKA
jgi:nitrogen-specific signal transduction histidine kinase